MTYTADTGNKTYTNVIPYATNIFAYGATEEQESKANGVINKNESYMFYDGTWKDLTDLKDDFTKTAFELDNERNITDNFKAMKVDRISIDNFPIKAIHVPADKHRLVLYSKYTIVFL